MKTSYRPEIDGLRAISIEPVVLFNFGFAAVRSGFVGVDIFLVISGFLVGGILWNELQYRGRIIDTWQRICTQDQCRAIQDEEVHYFDNNHLTNTEAIAIRDSYAPVFAPAEQGAD